MNNYFGKEPFLACPSWLQEPWNLAIYLGRGASFVRLVRFLLREISDAIHTACLTGNLGRELIWPLGSYPYTYEIPSCQCRARTHFHRCFVSALTVHYISAPQRPVVTDPDRFILAIGHRYIYQAVDFAHHHIFATKPERLEGTLESSKCTKSHHRFVEWHAGWHIYVTVLRQQLQMTHV
jgi:hypothetical protein